MFDGRAFVTSKFTTYAITYQSFRYVNQVFKYILHYRNSISLLNDSSLFNCSYRLRCRSPPSKFLTYPSIMKRYILIGKELSR